jgi:hypothetical protein
MLKACIEKIATGESCWIPIPNGDLSSAISDFAGDRDWECVLITGIKEDGVTIFPNNSFHKCDLFEFNNMLLQANDIQYIDENLVVLNLLLEHFNYDCEQVINAYENSTFRIYKNVKDFGSVAEEYLEYNSEWYSEFQEQRLLSYFDFKSYGEEVLEPNGTWLRDKNYKIIIEVFE